MAKNCINLELPIVKELHQQLVAGVTFSDISLEVTGANIALWQEGTNTDELPTLEELQDFMSAQGKVMSVPVTEIPADLFISPFEKEFRDPIERESRINMVVSGFGNYVTALIDREASETGVEPSSINRLNFIRKYGPDKILREAKESVIEPYTTNGGNTETIWDSIAESNPELTEEQVEEEVLRIQANYDKVAKYYWELIAAARPKLRRNEGLKVKEFTEQEDVQENPKERFGVDVTTISGYESLTALSRHFLSTIPMVDKDGVLSIDDLYQVRYLDADFTFSKIVELLPGTKSSSEMIDRLEKNTILYPWLQGVVDRLSQDNTLATTLFSNMNKAFMPFDIITKAGDPVTLNMGTSAKTFLNKVKFNLGSGVFLSDDAIYDASTKIDKTKVKALADTLVKQLKGYNQVSAANYVEYLTNPTNADYLSEVIANVYRALGFPVTAEDIGTLIKQYLEESNPINKIVGPLQAALSSLLKNKSIVDTSDWIDAQGTNFRKMAENFKALSQSTESSTRVGDKTRHSYVTPSYLSDLIDDIQDDTKRGQLFKEKFEKYPYFFNPATQTYYNDWLATLTKEGKKHIREAFRYKNMLRNRTGKEYSNWTVADHLEVMLTEFGTFIDSDKRASYSGYMMPTMSDAGTVLYLQAPRYDTGITSYQKKILDNLELTVYQEIIKINDIQDRAKRRASGEAIPFIKDYDGKPEFTFIPQLNSYKDEEGKSFLEKYEELQGHKEQLSSWIQSIIEPIVTDEFNNFMEILYNNGAFSSRVGKFSKDKSGEEAYQAAVTSVEKAMIAIDPEIAERPEVKRVLDRAKAVTILTSESELVAISKELSIIGQSLEIDTSAVKLVSPLKESINHFFWNDYLANIYMVQLLTTSSQFYGSDTNFYKRGKQWYAATRKLDRDVKPTLKMAIVSDVNSITPSEYISPIKELYNKLIEDGKITTDIKNRLLANMESINETDGEAFVTIESYRDMMLASTPELWTDAHESVYQKQIGQNSAPLTPEESAVAFQIMKPFVYTQTDMANGSKASTLPLPFQNKNSVMVLTPSMVIGNSKLEALLEFMNENSLDLLQFESAVKVGAQGKLNIEGNSKKEILANLNTQYIKNGQPRDGFTYTIDSRGFGIQQETPAHYLDSTTNIGVQSNRIVQSYLSKEDQAQVDQILIENATETYSELKELYTKPGKMYTMISESLKDDGRASNDTIKAVTPDFSGNIPIPLCNPLTDGVITPRVIAPFKQIIKQMISGGALIQATSFGRGTSTVKSEDLGVKFAEDGSIEYIECLMPATAKALIAPLLNTETGELDIDAKDAEGNPIVPESMRRIIAFRIPSEGANSIIPLRIKGFLPVSAGGTIITNPLVFPLTGSDLDVDKLFFYRKDHTKINDKFVETTEGRAGRNNAYFNLLYKAITSLEYTKDMMIISNFEEQKRAARIIEIITNPDIEAKYKHLPSLEKISTKELQALSERTISNVGGISSTVSKLTSAIRNMTGKNLIGAIANHSSNAILLKEYPSPIAKKYHFAIDTVNFNTINVKDTYLAVKQYLAAVVDNAKDPVLGSIGASEDTIQAVMGMVRAGFSPVQIGLLFNQPAFKGALSEYEKSGRKDKLTKFLRSYKNTLAERMGIDLSNYDTSLTSKELINSITGLKKRDPQAYYNTQLKVLENLTRVFEVGDYLADYVSVSRYDSSNSAPSVSVESIYSESLRVESFYNRKPLVKLPKLTDAVFSGEQALDSIKGDKFPVVKFIQAMYGLSYGGAINMLSKYYPQLSPYFSRIRGTIGIASLRKELYNNEIKLVNSSLMEYLLSSEVFPIEERAYYTQGQFEKDLKQALTTDKVLEQNYLLNRLSNVRNGGTIGLEDNGAINPVAREKYTNAWRGLVMSNNPTYKKLGLDLMKYCAYTYGTKFAPNSFIHLAPLEAQLLLPNYVSTLKAIENNQYSDAQGFLPQFYLNNIESENLVPSVVNTEGALFTSDDAAEDSFMLYPVASDTLNKQARDILYPENGISPGAFKVLDGKKYKVYVKYREVNQDSGTTSYYKRVDPITTNGNTYAYGKTIEEFIALTTPSIKESTQEYEYTTEDSNFGAGQYEGIIEETSVPFDLNLDQVDPSEDFINSLREIDMALIDATIDAALAKTFEEISEPESCKNI